MLNAYEAYNLIFLVTVPLSNFEEIVGLLQVSWW